MIHNDSFVCYVISVQASFGCSQFTRVYVIIHLFVIQSQFQSNLHNGSFVFYWISVSVEST